MDRDMTVGEVLEKGLQGLRDRIAVYMVDCARRGDVRPSPEESRFVAAMTVEAVCELFVILHLPADERQVRCFAIATLADAGFQAERMMRSGLS